MEGSLESCEVWAIGDLAIADVDKTVIGFFLGVFVDETTGVDWSHLGTVESLDFFELAGVLVAAVLGEAVKIC